MENTLNQFKEWIFFIVHNHPDSIRITQVLWPSELGIHAFDYKVELSISNRIYTGHGYDINQDLAICKATAEAIERYCVSFFKLRTSNGCSVHTDLDLAKQNAQFELIERDNFLVQFISGVGFTVIDLNFNKLKLPGGVRLENYKLLSQSTNVCLTRIVFDDYKQIFGLGVSDDVKSALSKSEAEALRQWSYYKNMDLTSYSDLDPSSVPLTSFDSHGDLAFSKKYFKQTVFLFNTASIDKSEFVDLKSEKFIYDSREVKELPENIFKKCPLSFVQCSHEEAQQLFIGQTIDHINSKRFKNKNPLNLCPHPFR